MDSGKTEDPNYIPFGAEATSHAYEHGLERGPMAVSLSSPPCTRIRKSYHMPTEILLRIFHYAIGSSGCRIKWQHASTDEYRFHYPHTQLMPNEIAKSTCTLCPLLNLHNWALVNHQWNAIVTPFLYTEIDIHTLAIPARVVPRPVLFRRDLWPFGTATDQVATSVTCVLAEPSSSPRLGTVVPVLKYGYRAKLRTRKFRRGKDEGLLAAGHMTQWQKWSGSTPREDQEYLVEFEYAPGEFELEFDPDNMDSEIDPINYKTKKMFEYAPIRVPEDCCFPKHDHHNFTPEWWDLLRIWEDPTEQNPITQYVLERVLQPLVRTLTGRPDLAALVRRIQLPLVVYQDYVILSSNEDPFKKRPLTLIGTDVTKPEEQRLRLREATRTASKGTESGPSVLINLLQSTLRLTEQCPYIGYLDGYWSVDIASLHQMRQSQPQGPALIMPETVQQNPSTAQLDVAMSEPQSGSSPRKQNRISRLFTRVISRKSSRNKLIENEASNADSLSSEGPDHSRSASNVSSGSSASESRAQASHQDVSISHNSLQTALFNSQTPSYLWTKILTTSMKNLEHWKLDFGSPLSRAIPDCSWTSHCGSNPLNKLCGKRYWHRYLDRENIKILTDLLCRDPPLSFLGWPLETLDNLVHFEFSTIEEDELHDDGRILPELRLRFDKALRNGLPNLRKLSVMDSYITFLGVVPSNKLESLHVSRWHTTAMHVSLVTDYLRRSYDSVDNKVDTALKELTLDTLSVKLGNAYWNGEDCYPLLIGGVSTCTVTLPCGAERQIFNCGDIHDQYFLKVETIYTIIEYAPNLRELVLRRGHLALDEYWKLQMEAKYMNWDVQRHSQSVSESSEEFHPPIAHNLTSLAFLVWGEGLRTWLVHSLNHDRMFPKLQYLTYAPAVSEVKRRERFRSWYQKGHEGHSLQHRRRDFRFWAWDPVIDSGLYNSTLRSSEAGLMKEAKIVDDEITEILRNRGVKVTKDRIMEGWSMSLPEYRSSITVMGSHQQRGPIPVDNVDSVRLWHWYYGQIRIWWLLSWRSPVIDRDVG